MTDERTDPASSTSDPDDRRAGPAGGPQSPAGGPQSPAGGPQSPAAEPPPAYPPPPGGVSTYGGPVPPGGWEQAAAPARGGYGPLAGFGSRFAALVIDGLIITIPAVIVLAAIGGGIAAVGGDDGGGGLAALIGAMILSVLAFTVIALLYAPLLMRRQGPNNGQTLGKQLLGIRVIRTNGRPMDFGTAALREVVIKGLAVGIASSIIPLIPFLLDYLWPLWDDENRALHDMAVSTRVVRA